MKKESPEKKKKPGRDLDVFDDLPSKTKELEILKDSAEKAAGPRKAALHEEIRHKSKSKPRQSE